MHLLKLLMARTFSLSMVLFGAMSSSMLFALLAKSVAQTVPDLPQAVICWSASGQVWRVGYLSQVSNDGIATYLSPGGQLSVTVSAKRIIEDPDNRAGEVDCYGKTIDELRGMSRTVEFQRTR
jgi:hypothetical protein